MRFPVFNYKEKRWLICSSVDLRLKKKLCVLFQKKREKIIVKLSEKACIENIGNWETFSFTGSLQ